MGGKAFFTLEDAKIAFNLFCCVYGIGTLGMPGNFSRAGPVIAVIALLFMAFANVYSSVACSKVMLIAPRTVKTYGDLGEWCMGKTGRWLVLVFQISNCLLTPCAFLVLGGTLLSSLFPGAFSDKTWIVLMAILVLPVVLIPTMKEGAGAAFAGCMGTLIGDIIGIGLLMHGMSGHPSVPSPDLSFKQVANTFGNLSLAYGAGIVIPALQRQHSDPTRMPRIIFVTMGSISVLFLVLASTGYSAVGCQISGNLLYSIFPDATTGLSKLGFHSDKGMAILAYLFMQLHITIAFSVILHPALYLLERMLLGMHQKKAEDIESSSHYEKVETPSGDLLTRLSKGSVVSMADIEKVSLDEDEESLEYRGTNVIKYILLRIAVVVILVVASVLLKDHFLDLTDFIGASAVTMNSIVLPIMFYLKVLWNKVPVWEKVPALVVVAVCFVLGCYVTYTSGKQLFNPDETDPEILFPFCHADEQRQLYWNASAN
uniref:Amino acid transporter transmembrane domain-containing protein n=1 Tax=Globisporangium ultimum (strain ATCC 200006 / CBS 805.95 / DAOM BR144) TaxID=431595 RepID=K3WR17_GLOUD